MGLIFAAAFFISWLLFAGFWFYIAFEVRQIIGCDTQYNDIQHNDIQHNDIQHYDTQQNETGDNNLIKSHTQQNNIQLNDLDCHLCLVLQKKSIDVDCQFAECYLADCHSGSISMLGIIKVGL
jgi:hypothetical protein